MERSQYLSPDSNHFNRATSEDVTVPRNKIPDFVRAVQSIAASIGIMIGLAGQPEMGICIHLFYSREVTPEAEAKAKVAMNQLIRAGLDLGGTISRRTRYRYS